MITNIELKNFKSFEYLNLNLKENQKKTKKIAAIYGENGSGKSTIVSAVQFIDDSLDTVAASKEILAIISERENFTSIDSLRERELSNLNNLEDLIRKNNLENTIQKNSILPLVTTGEFEGESSIKLGFSIDDNEGEYELSFNKDGLLYESLDYLINKQKGNLFSIKRNKLPNGINKELDIYFSPQLFLKQKRVETNLKEELNSIWGQHSFLSLYKYYVSTQLNQDTQKELNLNLAKVIQYFSHLTVLYRTKSSMEGSLASQKRLLGAITHGKAINLNTEKSLSHFKQDLTDLEDSLNEFFPRLYTDIRKVFYKSEVNGDEATYNLFFRKLINGKLIDVPYNLESTGTQKLLSIFPFIIAFLEGNTVIVDEIDDGIHDLLMKRIIGAVKDVLESEEDGDCSCHPGQLIFTTHDTTLMQDILGTKDIYLIEVDSNANKRIVSLDQLDKKLQSNHNIFKLYLERHLGGTPYDMSLDLEEISDILNINEE